MNLLVSDWQEQLATEQRRRSADLLAATEETIRAQARLLEERP